MTPEVSFGRWLSARRHLLDLTQDDLARQAGCAVVTIRKLEADERRPSRELAERLAACLALPPDERLAFLHLARASPQGMGSPGGTVLPRLPLAAPWSACPRPLPVPLTTMIGRDSELAAVRSRLIDDRARLLTLIGPPGVGKTRLAISAALTLAEQFAHGAAFIGLATIGQAELVLPVIAQVLGLQEQGGQLMAMQLQAYLRQRCMLLVLDNLEQVLGAAPALAELLMACPGVTALVTSRAALQVRGEQLLPVPPLPVPSLASPPPIDALVANPAVALFVERARALVPGFALSAEQAQAVAAICQELDGLPLAIELVAARARILPPSALLARLTPRLAFLTGGARDMPQRHRTLRQAIAWSYDLLASSEQALFRRMGIFVGGATLDAIEAVCAFAGVGPGVDLEGGRQADGSAPTGTDLLTLVTALVQQSLLQQEVGPGGEARFTMLATIREYAQEQLAAVGEQPVLSRRHADYYLSLATRGAVEVRGRAARVWLDRLSREHDNLRAALSWYHAQPDGTGSELELVASLWGYFLLRCHYAEGRAAIDRALARRDVDAPPSQSVAQALTGAGFLALFQGAFAHALAYGEASAAMWDRLGERWGMVLALNIIGGAHDELGDAARGAAALEAGLSLARAVGDPWCLALTLGNLAVTSAVRRDEARARALLEESLAIGQQEENPYFVAMATMNLGGWDLSRGDYDRAAARCMTALAIHQQLGDRVQSARLIGALADLAWERGAHAQAAAHYTTSLTVFEEIGDGKRSAYCRCRLGSLALASHLPDAAERHFRESLRLIGAQPFQMSTSLCLLGMAALMAERGLWERSVYLLAAAAAINSELDERLGATDAAQLDRLIVGAQERMSAATFDSAWAAGHTAGVEEVVRVASEGSAD